MTEPTEGSFRAYLDSVAQRTAADEWVVLSRDGAEIGETLLLDVDSSDAAGEMRQPCAVCVVDSQPVIVDGDVHYQVRLQAADLAPILLEPDVRRN